MCAFIDARDGSRSGCSVMLSAYEKGGSIPWEVVSLQMILIHEIDYSGSRHYAAVRVSPSTVH